MSSPSLIITADDFGRWPEVTDAVIAGYDNGVVSSAGLCVTATGSSSAMLSASMRPGLGVGLHLVLCDGQAALPRRHIPNVVDSSGRFPSRPLEAAWLFRHRAGLREELKAEIRAQVEKFLASGLNLTHISGRHNLHLHPTILSILKELAAEYPIAAIRRRCGDLVLSDHQQSGATGSARIEAQLLRWMVAWGGLRARGFVSTDRVSALTTSRPATESEVIARIKAVRSGVTELVCHPGSLAGIYDGAGEAACVTSPSVRRAIKDSGAELITYQTVVEEL